MIVKLPLRKPETFAIINTDRVDIVSIEDTAIDEAACILRARERAEGAKDESLILIVVALTATETATKLGATAIVT